MTYVHLEIIMRNDDKFAEAADLWAVPECLKDVEDVHIDVNHEDDASEIDWHKPVRFVTVSGHITLDTLEKLRSEWGVNPDDAEPAMGFLGDLGDGLPRLYNDERHWFGSDEFNVGGWSPVLSVSLSLIGEGTRPA